MTRPRIKLSKKDQTNIWVTTENIRELIEGENTRLTCILYDSYTIKQLVIDLSGDFLQKRTRQFKVKPYILFVFDEAQEFVRDLANPRGIKKDCSEKVETLLRQGRKCGLGGWMHCNTKDCLPQHKYLAATPYLLCRYIAQAL